MSVRSWPVVVLQVLGCGPGTSVAPEPVAPPPEVVPEHVLDAQEGPADLGSVDALTFGPDGHLVVGDGAKDRIVVILTEDVDWDEGAAEFGGIDDLDEQLAAALGVDEGDVLVTAMTVNPASGRVYLGVERSDTEWAGVFVVGSSGRLEWLDLAPLRWVRASWPEVDGRGSFVADVEWSGDGDGTLVAAVSESSWTRSQVVTFPVPVEHSAGATVTTTRTYHRTHSQWETLAPVTSLFSTSDADGEWIGASYACAPVVRFRVADLVEGAPETTGVTPFDFGGGRSVMDFAVVGTGRDEDLLASVSGLGGAEVSMALFTSGTNVDEEAPVIFGFDGDPLNDDADLAPRLDGALRVSPLDAERLVTWDGFALHTVGRPE